METHMDARQVGRWAWWAVVLFAGLAIALLLFTLSCAVTLTSPQLAPAAPRTCLDQQPPKLFLNAACKDGVCGYTCEPGRWDRVTEAPAPTVTNAPRHGPAW